MIALPLLHLVHHRFIRREPQDENERNNEDEVVEKQIPEPGQIRDLVVQESDDHEVGPAHARELADADQDTEPERSRNGGTLQKLRHGAMHNGRHFELDGHGGEESVQERDDAEDDEQRCTELPHEVRCVEQVQDLERAEPYREVCREDAGNVDAPNLQYLFTRELQPEEERYRDEKNGERAGMHAVEERRDEHERQKPCPALTCRPDERRSGRTELQDEYSENEYRYRAADNENSIHITGSRSPLFRTQVWHRSRR